MDEIKKILATSNDRSSLWINFLKNKTLTHVAEIGVYKGEFAEEILTSCDFIKKYYMVDPWRNLEDWNKPANMDDSTFNEFYEETLTRTDFAKGKRVVLRGKTTEVFGAIKEESLDFIYVDGDHTLKGITIDLITTWPKLKPHGYLAGDDFCPSIWQHNKKYEPTLVFPFAIYFAEAVNATIYGLPFNQFLLCKNDAGFQFIDCTQNKYEYLGLVSQFIQNKVVKKSPRLLEKIINKIK